MLEDQVVRWEHNIHTMSAMARLPNCHSDNLADMSETLRQKIPEISTRQAVTGATSMVFHAEVDSEVVDLHEAGRHRAAHAGLRAEGDVVDLPEADRHHTWRTTTWRTATWRSCD